MFFRNCLLCKGTSTFTLKFKTNVTVAENINLMELSDAHAAVVGYAKDRAGNMGASEIIFFTVDKQKPFPKAFVATASGVVVAFVFLDLIVYFKKSSIKQVDRFSFVTNSLKL